MQSIDYSRLLSVVFLSLVFTTACQKQSPDNSKEKVTASTQPNQSTSTNVHPPSPIQTQPQSLPQIQSTPIPEKVDLTQAHDINQAKDLTYLTALFLSKTTRQMTDDEKLGLISAEYANESDAFKKRELANKLLPQLNTTLDKYKGTYIIKMPLIDQNATKNLFTIKEFGKIGINC